MNCNFDNISDKTDETGLSVYIATYNVNRKPLNGLNLSRLLCECEKPPDIYAIGFQEVPWYISGSSINSWIRQSVLNELHPSASYELLDVVQTKMEILLVVFVRKCIVESGLLLHSKATASRHSIRRKGAVGLSLRLKSVSICFVNAHFYPHTQRVQQRKDDHDHTFDSMVFQYKSHELHIDEHDVVFFFGDLNYRLNTNFGRALCQKSLKNYDQLLNEMQSGHVFANYSEGQLNFIPTYKFDVGTNNWNAVRDPAWCDRILWKGDRVKQLAYQSVTNVMLSDHKPVYGIFRIQKELQSPNADGRKKVTLHKQIVAFPLMKFFETYTSPFHISNHHKNPISIRISVQQESEEFLENWLHIEPSEVTLAVGSTVTVHLQIRINSTNACVLQSKVELGESARRVPLGNVIIEQADEPIRRVTIIGTYFSRVFGHTIHKSKEIKILIQYLHDHALLLPDLFTDQTNNRIYSDHKDVKTIRDYLESDQSEELKDVDPHAVAECLLLLLESSPEPLIAAEEVTEHQVSTDFLCRMSDINKIVFFSIYDFLQKYRSYKNVNKSDLGRIALTFGGVLLKEHPAQIVKTFVGPHHDNHRTLFIARILSVGQHDFIEK